MKVFKVDSKRTGRKMNLVMHKMSGWKRKVFFSVFKWTEIVIYSSHFYHEHELLPCAAMHWCSRQLEILHQQPSELPNPSDLRPDWRGQQTACFPGPPLQHSLRQSQATWAAPTGKQSPCFFTQHLIPVGLRALWQSKHQHWFWQQQDEASVPLCSWLEPCRRYPCASVSIFGW